MGPVSVVIKVGGGLLADTGSLDTVLREIETVGRDCSLLVVPGGGPFADMVRQIDRQVGLSDHTAHWMAILAMDQYAHLIAPRLTNGKMVSAPGEIEAALRERRIPVLAPYQWMRDADPLPHSWDVTSDSISAWVAGQVGAPRIVLVKPPGGGGPTIVDACFNSVLPRHIKATIIPADRIVELSRAIAAPAI
jgi:aspartokinase-like uncharacterized kinase